MKIRIDRLRALVDHLRNGQLGHKKFDFSCINMNVTKRYEGSADSRYVDPPVNTCGTNGCAMGELPIVFPRSWKFVGAGFVGLRRGKANRCQDGHITKFFGIDDGMEDHLFYPCCQEPHRYGGKKLDGDASKIAVAKNIEAFIELVKAGKITHET